METIFLALGANVGDSSATIETAIGLLARELPMLQQAPVYRSKAFGYTDQPDFINTAVVAKTDLSPSELLTLCQSIERRLGRIRRFNWGPREIDIDIIFYGQQLVSQTGLTIPHPEFAKRDFVLQPISDLAPDFVEPASGKTIKALLAAIPAAQRSINI